MVSVTRRTWLTTLAAAPMAGGLAAWAVDEKQAGQTRKWETIPPRELIRQRHFPDVELVTHEGKRVRYYDDLIRDKKVVLNLMYAHCEGICIPVTSNLVRVQKLLGDRMGRDIFFYSITLKPEEDSPKVLKAYAKTHGVRPGWTFLTGKPETIELVRRRLGFVDIVPKVDANKSSHIGMIRFGNEPKVRWGACPAQASPEHIVRTLLWDLG